MASYFLKCREDTESKNSKVTKAKNGRILLLSKFAVYGSKKSKFVIEREANKQVFISSSKSLPEMRLRQPRFTYLACGPFTKNKERI